MYKRIFVLCQAAVGVAIREGVYKKLKDIFPDSLVKVPFVPGSDQITKGTADVIMVLTQNNSPEDLDIATGLIPGMIDEARKRGKPVVHIRKECDKAVVVDFDEGVVLSSAVNTLTWLAKNNLDYEYNWMRDLLKKKKLNAVHKASREEEARVKAGWAAAAGLTLKSTTSSRDQHLGRVERTPKDSYDGYAYYYDPAPFEGLDNQGRIRPASNGVGLNEQISKDLRQIYTPRKNVTAPVDKTHAPDGIFRIDIYDGTEMLFDKNLMLLFR